MVNDTSIIRMSQNSKGKKTKSFHVNFDDLSFLSSFVWASMSLGHTQARIAEPKIVKSMKAPTRKKIMLTIFHKFKNLCKLAFIPYHYNNIRSIETSSIFHV